MFNDRRQSPNRRARLPQVDDAPHVRAEPHGRAGVGLVLPDEDGMGDGQQAHQRAVLKELQDFRLVRQTPEGNNESLIRTIKDAQTSADFIYLFI